MAAHRRKEDQFLDLPISLDALQLVLLNRGFSQVNRQSTSRRWTRSCMGLTDGSFVWPCRQLVPQKTQVPVDTVSLIPDERQPGDGED